MPTPSKVRLSRAEYDAVLTSDPQLLQRLVAAAKRTAWTLYGVTYYL